MATKLKRKKTTPAKKILSSGRKNPVSAKATVKKQVKKSAVSKASSSSHKGVSMKSATTAKSLRMRRLYILLAVLIILIGILIFNFKSLFVAAMVNGQPITRLSVVSEAEKQSGKQALDVIVRNTLVEQEAQKEHVTVSDQEVNDEIKKLEANLANQGQKLDQVLALQGLTQDDLRKLIRVDKLVNKMVGSSVTVSSKDVDAYIEKNKDSLPQNQTDEQLRASVTSQLKKQALSAKVQAFLAKLQSKAKIQYFVQY